MMKTLCVVAVVLSLTSVCRSAPSACEKLMKPLDKNPDWSGRWYVIAVSSDTCLAPALFNALFWPSVAVNITAQAKPNVYNSTIMINMFGHFCSVSETLRLDYNTFVDGDTGQSKLLLQTGCPDCLAMKAKDNIDIFLLLSRRQTVSAAELQEFETQSDCLRYYKPQVLNTDHEYVNCQKVEDNADIDEPTFSMMFEKVKSKSTVPLGCITESVLYVPRAAYQWATEKWNNLW